MPIDVSGPRIKSTAAGDGGCRIRKPAVFPATDPVGEGPRRFRPDSASGSARLAMLCCLWFGVSGAATAQTDDERLAEEIRRATAARAEAIPQAARDPYRPMFHYRPPAQWMNDICGTVFHNGFHHVFYQNNPYSADQYGWGWGHARSKDLVHWEELPFALVPMTHRGELRCNSGNVALDADGKPMIFFTSVPRHGGVRSQWAATPLDDDLIRWRRVGDRPIMERGKDGIPGDKVHPSWSDPYLFKKDGRTFVTFKKAQGMVCEARDPTLTRWTFLGFMAGVAGECPNVFELGGKCVILRSTHPLSSVIGDLVLARDSIRFDADGPAVSLDYGFGDRPPEDRTKGQTRGFYGTNAYEDTAGRRILCGWISGFRTGRGWNGCMSLPRILTLDRKNRIVQTPVPELEALRGAHTRLGRIPLSSEVRLVEGVSGSQLEVVAEFDPGTAGAVGIKLRCGSDAQRGIVLRFADGVLDVAGTAVPIEPDDAGKTLGLRIFLDHSVLEVFINGGRKAVTRVEYPDENDLAVAVFAEDGDAIVQSLDAWVLKSIW